ncbi:hypothetical protein FACS1894189_0130 [Planctomycetales bacterium]|nr:hypothetical protein FACS1894189_0130 [Planctomycetales bacterium]
MSNLYAELDLFLDPATTDANQLKSELQNKIKTWNRNPGMYSYQIYLANDFIKNSGNYNLAQLANEARSEKEQAGKTEVAVYEEDGIVESQEADALVNKYQKWFTSKTITSWFALQIQSGAQFVPPQEPDYLKTAKVVSPGDMKKLASDLKIVLNKDDATMYDLLGMKQSASCEELEAKRLALYADSQKDPNKGRSPVVDAKIRLLGKVYFKDVASKRGYDLAIGQRPFYKIAETKLRARTIKGYITTDDYENSIKETVAAGIGRKTAEYLVYHFFYNACGITEPPRFVAKPKNEAGADGIGTILKPVQQEALYNVVLANYDPFREHNLVKVICNTNDWDSSYTLNLIRGTRPLTIKNDISQAEAERMVNNLEAAGGTVRTHPPLSQTGKIQPVPVPLPKTEKLQPVPVPLSELTMLPDPKDTENLEAGHRLVLTISGIPFAFRWCPKNKLTAMPNKNVTKSGFWMGETQVTQEQWKGIMEYNLSEYKGNKRPVTNVSWDDCQVFIQQLNQLTANCRSGFRFSLPSEAQWEYACRAGTTTPFAGKLDEMGWYDANSGGATHPVGLLKPNAWGLFDMHGNVCEWCKDAYSACHRKYRGGSYRNTGGECRSDASDGTKISFGWLGLRLCLVDTQ